jgi:uncharacterized protein (TIGR02453 family)
MKSSPFDLDVYPPFQGYPKAGINFLRKLKRNNNRQWFEKHKEDFETDVKLPMQSIISSLQPYFDSFAPQFDINPKRSLFRIYRDIRFSKDKTPYKTHVAAHFVLRGKPKGVEGSGFYLHIEPGEIFLGGGIYTPDSDQLKSIRRAIAERSKEFLMIVSDKSFVRRFKKIDGDKLQRVPRGYDPGHPMAEWLKLKQFFVGVEWKQEKCLKKSFIEEIAKVYEEATPLVMFLNDALK